MAEEGTVEPQRQAPHQHQAPRDCVGTDEIRGALPARRLGTQTSSRTRVVLLGSGGLSRELVVALQRLGAEVIAVDRFAPGPLFTIADRSMVVDLADGDELTAAVRRLQPKFVVTGADVVASDELAAIVATGLAELVPNIRSTRLAADMEGMRRLAADQLGLPTAPFWFAGSVDQLRAVADHAGFPVVVKPAVAGLEEGRSVMVRTEDIEPAWRLAVRAGDDAVGVRPDGEGRSDADGRTDPVPGPSARVLVETVVEIDHEVTLLVVSSGGVTGPVLQFCVPIGHRRIEGPNGWVVLESWQPHVMSPRAADAARSIAARVVRALGGRGVFGVELLVSGDEVYFSDIAVWPYDTALLTLRTQRLPGFEMQARAILGLPVDSIMISPGAARLIYSGRAAADREAGVDQPGADAVLAGALRVPESGVLMFHDDEGHVRRRLGMAMATASDVATARQRAEQVSMALARLWT